MSELTDKIEGKFHEVKGKVTDDKSEEMQGKAQQAKGAVKGKFNDLRDKVQAQAYRNEHNGDNSSDTDSDDGTYGETTTTTTTTY